MGVVANYYQTVKDEAVEEQLRNFIMKLGGQFDISANGTHFAYIPFSTKAGDFGEGSNQWFRNSFISHISSGDKTQARQYLNEVIMPDTGDNRGMICISFEQSFTLMCVFLIFVSSLSDFFIIYTSEYSKATCNFQC